MRIKPDVGNSDALSTMIVVCSSPMSFVRAQVIGGGAPQTSTVSVLTIATDNAPQDAGVPKKNSHQPNKNATGRP